MGTVTKRQRSRRRLAAFSFLSNISLDGTHRDTKLGIYNLSLQSDSTKFESAVNKQVSDAEITWNDSLSDICQTQSGTTSEEKLHGQVQICNASPRERVHSFVGETKAKFLSQRKKNVTHSVHDHRSCSSAESIALCATHQASNNISDNSDPKFLRSPRAFRSERVVLLSSSKVPFLVFSSLAYNKKATNNAARVDVKQDGSRRRQTSGSMRALSVINDEMDPLHLFVFGIPHTEEGQDVSYGFLLTSIGAATHRKYRPQESDFLVIPCPHMNRCHSFDPSVSNVLPCNKPPTTPPYNFDRGFDFSETKFCHHSACLSYTPNLLDDPELVTGKHSTVLSFSSYITSIIDYVKPSDLKKELNEKFKERFPHIHLTLSKLRSLKREMYKITHIECGIDLLTLAQAYVFFEKLILKMLINKQNRKLCAAACVLLSAKLNDVKGQDLKNLIEKLESGFRLNHKDLITSEFCVLVALEFSLHLPTWEVFPHYQRLLYES